MNSWLNMNPKKQLQKLIDDIKTKKFRETEAGGIRDEVGGQLKKEFSPVFQELTKEVKEALKGVKFDIPKNDPTPINYQAPEINIPDFPSFPEIPAPIVNVAPPIINIPDIQMPDEMNIKGFVSLMGVSLENPLPVQIRDASGAPVDFSKIGQVAINGGSGGPHIVKVSNVLSTVGVVTVNPDGSPTYSTSSSGSGSTTVSLVNVDGTYYDSDNPLPVTFSAASIQPVSQVSGHNWSVFASLDTTSVLYNADNRLRVSLETGGSGLTDAELRATAVPVSQLSGASWSTEATQSGTWNIGTVTTVTAVTGITNSIAAVIVDTNGVGYTTSNPVPVSFSATDLDIRDLANATDSISSYQVSGASWSVEATQSGTWDIGTVTAVTGVTNSVSAALVDSANVQYSGSNPVPMSIINLGTAAIKVSQGDGANATGAQNILPMMVNSSGTHDRMRNGEGESVGALRVVLASNATGSVFVTGSSGTVAVVGVVVSDAADDGSAPNKIGGIARTANPTAVANGDAVSASFDSVGRQLVRPHQVRGLMQTAYATITDSSEDNLITGSASVYLDLVYIMGANNSNATVNVDIRDKTAGGVVASLSIPANSTAGMALPIPIPQDTSGQPWTVQNSGSDISNTTVKLTALFTKEV